MGNKPSLPANEAIYHSAKHGRHMELESILRNVHPGTQPANLLEWQDDEGRTALIVASGKNHPECVSLLLRYGANVQHMSRRREGGSALHEAIYKQANPKIIDALLKYGASPFVENVSRFTAMDYAIVKKDAAALRRLERCGYFSQYLRIRIKKNFGLSKTWAPQWIAIVPRHGCPLRSQQLSRRMLFVYHDARSFDPIGKLYLDGSTAKEVVGDHGQSQALLALHHTHVQPKLFASSKDAAGKWIINFRPLHDDVSVVKQFIQAVSLRHDIPVRALEGEDDSVFAQRLATYGSGVGQIPEGMEEEAASRMEPLRQVPSVHPESAQTSLSDVYDDCRRDPMIIDRPEQPESSEAIMEEDEFDEASAPPLPPEYSAEDGSMQPTGHHASFDRLGQDSMELDDDDLCVICLDKPRTVGFVHGSSIHRCVCQECAAALMKEKNFLCPVCRQPVEHVITDFFF